MDFKLTVFRMQLSTMVLTVALQVVPLARTVVTAAWQAAPSFAVIFKWSMGTAAVMGGYDAVSGASTTITSPSSATGKVGQQFFFRITTAPKAAEIFGAEPLPGGLMMGTGNFKSYIMGMPTEVGTTNIKLTASKDGYKSISKNLMLTIEPAGASAPEVDRVRLEGMQLYLYFKTIKGKFYRVDASASLSRGTWSSVSTLAATGGEVSFSAPVVDTDQVFYRIVLLD